MTPFESELAQTAWPVVSSVLGAIAVWYLKTLTKSIADLVASVAAVRENIAKVEHEIKSDLAEFKRQSQHKIDTIIGSTNTRLGQVETVCSMQHGVTFKRRSTDSENWAQTSDVSGKISQ